MLINATNNNDFELSIILSILFIWEIFTANIDVLMWIHLYNANHVINLIAIFNCLTVKNDNLEMTLT